MSSNATEGTGQESGTQGAGGQGQEPPAENGNQGQEPGAQGQQFDPSTISDPAVKAYLEKVQKDATEARQEAARYRTERNHLQEAQTQRERDSETAEQTAAREAAERQERLDRLERENRDLKVGAILRERATAAKAHNPALVASMIDAKVSLDDKGEPSNVEDLLAELRESDPYLFKRTRTDAGEGNGGNGETAATGNMNDIIREQFTARRGR